MDNLSYIFVSVFIFIMMWKSNTLGKKFGVMSFPDKTRKFHKNSVPQVGGIVFFFFLVLITFLNYSNIFALLENFTGPKNINKVFFILSFLMLFVLGFLDDRQNLNAKNKLIILIFIGYVLFTSIPSYQLSYFKFSFMKNIDLLNYGIFVSIFFFVLLINMMNMFDGINLQTTSYFFILWVYIVSYSVLDLILAVNLIFLILFFYFNYKNRIFLGDCGVYMLTFFSFIYLLRIYNDEKLVTIDELLILFLLPCIDCCRVIFIRILRKKNPLLGDREHFHHLLLKKYNYAVTLFIILFVSVVPIILYKILDLGLIISIIIFFQFYILGMMPKKYSNFFLWKKN